MISKRIFLQIFFLCASSNVLCLAKVPCALNDAVCVVGAAKTMYDLVISGVPDIGLESLEPIRLNVIEAPLPGMNYTLTDINFHGMKDCHVEKFNLDTKAKTMFLYLVCPYLELDSNYYLKGNLESMYIEGEGRCRVTHDEYHVGILGNIEITNDKQGKSHLNIKDFKLPELDVKKLVIYRFDNLFYGDEEKSKATHAFVNKNWKKMSIATQEPAMNALMGKLVDHMNKYFMAVSMDDIFYKNT